MSLTLLTKDDQLFSKENTFLVVIKVKIYNLIIPETHSFVTHVPTSYEEVDTDDVYVTRYDHEEDVWEN